MASKGDDSTAMTGSHLRREYQGYQWYLMAWLAFTLLVLCSLIAGLTLAVCGLDMTWLEMRSITGTAKQRKQVRVIIRMKKHASWMLCSLIICSVGCSEYFPFVIQNLCGSVEEWVPVLLSTVLLALFAEIFPQWLIPRHAVSWGYYCWPLIWGCMWLTSIVSYPLAWLLDSLGAGRRDVIDVFTNDQLCAIIKYHERSEKRGGDLSADATRIILGVLNNDGRKIGGEIARIPEPSFDDDAGKDIEKADPMITRGMIVKWSAVKTIDIDEVVDKAFIEKVMSWSYSRVPVVGKPLIDNEKDATLKAGSDWDGKQVFGFLHIKNLIGLGELGSTLLVKDLPLYPLPIIRDDMSVYELLYMFQLGMSRMAIVVPASKSLMNDSPPKPALRWTGTERTKAKIESRIRGSKKDLSDWTTDYLAAAQASMDSLALKSRRIQGIRSPKPIGIITFEDIIDALLQRTSRDEKDFFDRESVFPPTKVMKVGDCQPGLSNIVLSSVDSDGDASVQKVDKIKDLSTGTLRKRKVSKIRGGDGADDQSIGGEVELRVLKIRKDESLSAEQPRKDKIGSSSYTDNSQGGFHVTNNSTLSINESLPVEALSYMTMTAWATENGMSPFESATLPSRKIGVANTPRSRYFSAAPRMTFNPLATPFSRQTFSSFQSGDDELVVPPRSEKRKSVPGSKQILTSDAQHARERTEQRSTGDTISLSSWGERIEKDSSIFDADIFSSPLDPAKGYDLVRTGHNSKSRSADKTVIDEHTPIHMESPSSKPYEGFPLELLDSNKENHCPDYSSMTMPRLTGFIDEELLAEESDSSDTLNRNQSIPDDRAMLPSQKRALIENTSSGNRSSSMWL